MPSANRNITVTTTPSTVFTGSSEEGGNCASFLVRCRSDSLNDALVSIEGLHVTGEFALIPVGYEQVFRLNYNGISDVKVRGDLGDAKIDYFVVAKLES